MTTFQKPFTLAFILLAFALCQFASAQPAQVRGEFIESSSPLRNGGNVTTRAEPGRRIQTTVTLPRGAVRRVAQVQNPTPVNQGGSVLETSGTTVGNQPQSTTNTNAARYPYPANYSPRVVANPYQPNPNRVSASRVQMANNCNCNQVPVNGLGLTAAPNFNGAQNRQVLPTATFQNNGALVGQGVQPVLSQPPQIQYQIPDQTQGGVPQYGAQIGVPQFGNTNPNPWVAGTPGAYQPLVRVFNMPQGTFLGQGIVGQPEAYVNGQPIANFFRYLLPF